MKRNGSLNHVFRLIWNHATNAWVAVAETSRGRGKSGRTQRSVLAAALLAMPIAAAQAAPAGGQVTAGSGSVSQNGAETTVTQNSATLSMSWQSFNIGKSETVNFVQPTAQSIAVNRILDTNGSEILGRLNANGQVWLINPNGLLFGRDAQVNVGGLVASTLDVSDDSLGGSSHRFEGTSTAGVINQGRISASEGGSVVLLGHQVSNTGTISAQLGTVALGAGNITTLQFDGNRLVNLRVDENLLDALADNGGMLQADGGQVLMSAGARNSVLASVVNNTGVIEARTVEQSAGRIVLLGGMGSGTAHVAGTLDASAPEGGSGGFIETSAHKVHVADGTRISTNAPQGYNGTWLIGSTDFTVTEGDGVQTLSGIGAYTLSDNLGSTNVTIATDTSGESSPDAAGNINVNAQVSWSANKLTLSAWNDINVNAALNGSGTASLALEYGQGALNAGNTSQYNINAPVSLPAGDNFSTRQGSDGDLLGWKVITELGAEGSTSGTDLQGISGNLTGRYVLGADIDATATADWSTGEGFSPIGGRGDTLFGGSFDGLGHTISNLTISRPSENFVGLFGGTDLGSSVGNVGLTDLVVIGSTNVGGLAGINYGTISASYATGSLSGNDNVGGLVGLNGGVISSSYATGSVSGLGVSIGGLVGYNSSVISYAGDVSEPNGDVHVWWGYWVSIGNIDNSYATGSVSGSSDYVGGLVGYNAGSISNSHASGSASGAGYHVGGLVGYHDGTIGYPSEYAVAPSDYGTDTPSPYARSMVVFTIGSISNSHAAGSVSGGNMVGGLVGSSSGLIIDSQATGSVSGNDNVGGLLGYNSGTVSRSFAANNSSSFAANSVSGNNSVGGLVGTNDGSIFDSQATSSVSGNDNVGGLLGLNRGLVISSFAASTVSGGSTVGGLVGSNGGTLFNGQAIGDVNGSSKVGALVGSNSGVVYYSQAAGNVIGIDNVGGLAGVNEGSVLYSQATGSVSGNDNVGGLVGLNSGSISTSYATGNVSGSGVSVGGLVGYSTGSIDSSFAANDVSGNYSVGGLVGANSGAVLYSQAAGNVSGIDNVGGLAGVNEGSVLYNNQATGSVSGNDNVGGLLGYNSGTLSSSFAANDVSGNNSVGGLVGFNEGSISSSYAKGSVNGLGASVGGLVGYNSSVVSYANIVSGPDDYVGGLLDYQDGAMGYVSECALAPIDYGTGTPSLSVRYMPFSTTGSISNSHATGSVSGGSMVGGLVGSNSGLIIASHAKGSVSGNDNVGGLLGYNNGTVSSSFVGNNVSGNYSVGGLVGTNDGSIFVSQATGYVSGIDNVGGLAGVNRGSVLGSQATAGVSGNDNVGGLLGYNSGTLSSSFAANDVSGNNSVGGLVGFNEGGISTSYATGSGVRGNADVGGLVGTNYAGTVTSSFWNIDTTGQASSAGGGVGLTQEQMTTAASYADWDFTSTWMIFEGLTAPLLRSYMTVPPVFWIVAPREYHPYPILVADPILVVDPVAVVDPIAVDVPIAIYDRKELERVTTVTHTEPSLSPAHMPKEVSAVTTQLASTEAVFNTGSSASPLASRSGLRPRTLGSGIRLHENSETAE